MTDPNTNSTTKLEKTQGNSWAWLGIGLILLSGLFFASLFVVPWLPFGGGIRVIIGGALFLAMQLAWWSGVALAGASTIRSIRLRIFRR